MEGGRWRVEDGWWKTEGWRKEKRLKEDEGGRKKREEEGWRKMTRKEE